MKTVVMLLQALCGDDKTLYAQVREELQELITRDDDTGYRQVNDAGAIRLVLELECSDYIGAMVSRAEAAKLLKQKAENPEMIERIFAQKGQDFQVGDMFGHYPPA